MINQLTLNLSQLFRLDYVSFTVLASRDSMNLRSIHFKARYFIVQKSLLTCFCFLSLLEKYEYDISKLSTGKVDC